MSVMAEGMGISNDVGLLTCRSGFSPTTSYRHAPTPTSGAIASFQ